MKQIGEHLGQVKTRGDFRQLNASRKPDSKIDLDPYHPIWELWDRMTEFYGSAFLAQYGEKPNLTWVEMLKDLTQEQFTNGFHCLKDRDNPFPPNPAEFRILCEINNGWERQCHRIIDTSNLLEDTTAKEARKATGRSEIRRLREATGL